MSAVDFDSLTLVDVVALLQSRVLSSQSLVREAVHRTHLLPELSAISVLDSERALAAARQADALVASLPFTSPLPRPLAGVPVLIKDSCHIAGLPNSAGTPALLPYIPDEDAEVVQRLRRAGAIILGKTHMHELAYGITSYNALAEHQGQVGVRNAYDTRHIAGGSSGGSGAALGARVVYAALGSDTGGSVRIPAALNGVCGLRPTVLRYSQDGLTPLSHTRDTVGPMAHSMADVELLDRVLTQSDPVTPPPLTRIRLGVVKDFMRDLDADTEAAITAAFKRLQGAGVTMVELDVPDFFRLYQATGPVIVSYECYDDLSSYVQRYQPELTLQEIIDKALCPDLRSLFHNVVLPRKTMSPEGSLVDAEAAYLEAIREGRPALQRLYASTLAEHQLDGLAFPTVCRMAVLAEEGCSSRENAATFIRQVGPGSVAGVPGICLPVGLGKKVRLPVSLGVDGHNGKDRELIGVGMALEGVLGRLAPPEWVTQRLSKEVARPHRTRSNSAIAEL